MAGWTVKNLFKLAITSLVIIVGSAFYQSSSLLLGGRSNTSSSINSYPGNIRLSSAPVIMTVHQSSWLPTRSQEMLDPEAVWKRIPQMAKDADFGRAVIEKWNEEVAEMKESGTYCDYGSETKIFEYQDPADGKTLYGHLVRRIQKRSDITTQKVPGILFFHTGAGPHDISLLWKADLLACNTDVFPNGCVILVTDILSDDSGWGWGSDRTKYSEARAHVLATKEGSAEKPLLQSRIHSAIKGLQEAAPEVDVNQLSALGWCLGGHSVFELGRMKLPGMKAMVTFHGVFDGVEPTNSRETTTIATESTAEILIANGLLDPFVDQKTVLKNAVDTLQKLGHKVRLLQLEGARHGFSNPAQDFNENEAFAYNAEAADTAWSEATALLKRTFSS